MGRKKQPPRTTPTPRQEAVWEALARDEKWTDVARRLGISESVLAAHQKKLLLLTGVKTRVGLALARRPAAVCKAEPTAGGDDSYFDDADMGV